MLPPGTCECQFLVAQAGCISVPFAFTCSREIPETELCSFLGSRGTSALERAMLTLFHVCLAHPPAGAEFSLWWSLGWYLLQPWFLPRAPEAAGGAGAAPGAVGPGGGSGALAEPCPGAL